MLGPEALRFRDESDERKPLVEWPEGAADALPTYFNWRKASIYAGSNEVQRGIITKAILKL